MAESFRRGLVRFAILMPLWWILSEGRGDALVTGVLAAAVVAVVSVRLFPAARYSLHWRAVPAFLVFFLGRSVAAGLDVAARLLRPSLPIFPQEQSFSLRLPAGAPRWLLANILSLLPGTLSVELRGARLTLHCLDRGADNGAAVQQVEARVAALFGLTLEPRS